MVELRGDLERRPVREHLPAVVVEPRLRLAVVRSTALDELPELKIGRASCRERV